MKALLIPSLKKNGGTGHLFRAARLLSVLGPNSRVLAPAGASGRGENAEWTADEVLKLTGGRLDSGRLTAAFWDAWDCLIFDRRETTREEFFRFSLGRPSVGLDEGGAARPLFSFLIDTFPRVLFPHLPANIEDQTLIARGPRRPPRVPARLETALVSFGGEDPAGLTTLLLSAARAAGLFPPEKTGIVRGPAFSSPSPENRGRVYTGITELQPLFENYDCVFTSFGITPYEALAAGCLPILVNPGPYHEKLSRKAGFTSLGVKRISRGKLKLLAANPSRVRLPPRPEKENTFAEIFADFAPGPGSRCPACGALSRRPLLRLRAASFFVCGDCGITFRENFSPREIRYDANYFFADYRRQYGKTYLEDFGTIKNFARERLAILAHLGASRVFSRAKRAEKNTRRAFRGSANRSGLLRDLSRKRLNPSNPLRGAENPGAGLKGKTLLDIGCAYGPFLATAREAGCLPRGLDIAEDAVRYVRDELGIPALQGDFPALSAKTLAPDGPYDIVTLWYVIEHFRDIRLVLQKIAEILAPGGLLAFSTPNSKGVSGRFSRRAFLANSPADHYTLWDARSAWELLRRAGFRLRKIRVTGHHPERFPRIFRLFGRRACEFFSRLFGWGDTFEVYAEKMP